MEIEPWEQPVLPALQARLTSLPEKVYAHL